MAFGTQLFTAVTKFGRQHPQFKKSEQAALDWYRDLAKSMNVADPDEVAKYYTERRGIDRIRAMTAKGGSFNYNLMGRLVVFKYKALHAETLPYWDALPVIFPIKMMRRGPYVTKTGGPGFLGINLHYLPTNLRAKLMDAIYTQYKMKHLNERKRLQLTYEILNSTANMKVFKPCVKHYLFKQISSRFNVIAPNEWDFVAFLPIAQWRKASESKVHSDSRKIIRGS